MKSETNSDQNMANHECLKASDMMMKYMDGELCEKEAVKLREHVALCPSCKADFELYDFICEKLTDNGGLTSAPEKFTESVMNLVAALPTPKKQAASAFDRIMGVTLGLFSLLFGLGFLLVINRDQIIARLYSIPALQGYVQIVEPRAQWIGEAFAGLLESVQAGFMSAFGFISEHRFIIFGVFAVLVVGQVILFRSARKKHEKA